MKGIGQLLFIAAILFMLAIWLLTEKDKAPTTPRPSTPVTLVHSSAR